MITEVSGGEHLARPNPDGSRRGHRMAGRTWSGRRARPRLRRRLHVSGSQVAHPRLPETRPARTHTTSPNMEALAMSSRLARLFASVTLLAALFAGSALS